MGYRTVLIRQAAMQLIAGSKWFPEVVATAPQIQALCGTNPIVIVILSAPLEATAPEVKAFY
jgi:hypothetical protein